MNAYRLLVSASLALLLGSGAPALGQGGLPPEWNPGACARTETVPSDTLQNLLPATTCECKGEQLDITGFVNVGGVRIGVTPDGDHVDSDVPICLGYTLYPAYEKYVPGGNTTVRPGAKVGVYYYAPVCDKSDCGGFLFWSWGAAECGYMPPQDAGSIQSYYMTGDACFGDGPLPPSP